MSETGEERVQPSRPRGDDVPPWFREPTFAQRLLGRLVDIAVALPAVAAVSAVAEGAARQAVGLALTVAYEIVLLSYGGQTVGKMAMRTRVVDRSSGELVTLQQATKRVLTVIAGAVVALVIPAIDPVALVYGCIVVLPILLAPLHRGLHDRAAGTIVTSVAT